MRSTNKKAAHIEKNCALMRRRVRIAAADARNSEFQRPWEPPRQPKGRQNVAQTESVCSITERKAHEGEHAKNLLGMEF